MELFTLGLPLALSTHNLLYCLLGVALGTAVGVLPGIGPLATISMLLPLTFHMEPVTALIMLAGVYYGSEYGGRITSILLNIPGEAASAVTALDGYPMTRGGQAGVALFVTAVSSFVGGILGIFTLMLFSPVLVDVALSFGPSEYFAAMLLGLLASASISSGGPLRGIAMVLVGLLTGTIGLDIYTGVTRYTFGYPELFNGVGIIILAIGLFGVAEIIASIDVMSGGVFRDKVKLRSMVPTREDTRRSVMPTLRGSGIGCLLGALPGTGPLLASFTSYLLEKRLSKTPQAFGKGAIEGVVSPEAANNSAAQTAFIPTLTLGIPGSSTMAVMLGALMIHGITPGPLFPQNHPDVFWGLIASFWIGNIMLLVLNIPMVGMWIRLLQVPYHLLYPVVLVLICVGVYSVHNSLFDIVLVGIVGVIGYLMRILDLHPAPLLLAFILGPMLEVNLRRALLLSEGRFMDLVERPISGTLLALCGLIVVWMAVSTFYSAFSARAVERPKAEGST